MYDMRAPDGRHGYNRPGRTFEEELNLRYLSPGAFTVLSPEESGSPPDPPPAPQQYRLSPNANVRRNKNQSFAIIAEPANYEPSRSPSPTSGRVSPFRGRGFNPTGSRHASPAASPPPPPEDNRLSYQQNNNNINNRKRSHIPQLKRHNSSSMLSTEESSDSSPKHQRRNSLLKPQLSRSLNNIGPRTSNKPPAPPGSRRPGGIYSRNSSFSRLSPIIGSSPEPSTDSKSQSSPSRIPMSRSSPNSRKHSPENDRAHHGSSSNLNNKHLSVSNAGLSRSRSRVGSQAASRSNSRTASRNPSREPSPSGKPPISPTKTTRNYRNVQAKVNSFNAKSKTKVPNSNGSSLHSTHPSSTNRLKQSDRNKTKTSSNSKLNRTESISNVSKSTKKSSANNSKSNNNSSTMNENNNNINKSSATNGHSTSTSTNSGTPKSPEKKFLKKTPSTRSLIKKGTDSDTSSGTTTSGTTGSSSSPTKKVEPLPRITEMLPPATVLSTTTDTVTKPLKIEATIDTPLKTSASGTNILAMPIKETPMYMDEGRVLSAKSVSSAIERMNDTVLDAETLLKDHNMSKLSPAATAIISLSSEPPPHQSQMGMPSVETTKTTASASFGGGGTITSGNGGVTHVTIGNNGQSVNSSSIVTSSNRAGGPQMVKNNINKLISPDDSFGARVHYENSGTGQTVLKQEVQPIKIVVQEKGQDMEVQSGNVRFPPNATNGTAQGAGAPPHTGAEGMESDQIPTSRCGRFMHKFKQKMSCGCCKRSEKSNQDDTSKQGCFACLKKKKMHDVEDIIISSADDAEEAKKSFMQKLKCCSCRRSNKVGDSTTGCCGLGKMEKDKWTERRDSILSAPVPLTAGQRCKNFFKLLFCCWCGCGTCRCCKKTPPPPKIEDATSRRASLLSKKKSLTPTVIPQEDPKNKLDSSLVEYTSTMKAAIPVLPIALAYFCLFFNIFAPGTGTVFSGLFCLCMGKPRFSQRDDPKSRFGSFLINIFIGAGQLFTVLFCLVGWGWSIWWGVIMIKVAKKYRKIKLLEQRMEAQQEKETGSRSKEGSQKRDVEKGRS